MFIAFFTNPYAFAFDYFRIANDYSCLSVDLNFLSVLDALKKPGFLPDLRAGTKDFRKKTRFLDLDAPRLFNPKSKI
ncbi:MAG TPA: hypothetical protein DD001_23630 [Microcoleaceae bacterium UBA10368]|jgi:hypothetical protein|nr:hypothetical protein [Microcoleaceae cyanobacterium UBA10368]HCV28897.1 hypothetical protein [Microcoleaceae cyanobacterium UBA9251]